jgi:hypothetical protein
LKSPTLANVGIPIPIYLDEKLTGIYVTSQEKNIDIDSQPEISTDGKTRVTQRGVNNTVTVNFIASKSALLLSVLLAFSDEAFKRAVNGNYGVTYLNGATLVFGGKVQTFSAQESHEDDLVRITMAIHKVNQETKTASTIAPLEPTPGTIAGPAGT